MTKEKHKSGTRDGKKEGRGNFWKERLSVAQTISENREQRVGCVAGRLEARVAFTLADINGF